MTLDRVSLFFAARRLHLAGLRLLRAVFDGFWLGVLDDDDVAEINRRYYAERPEYVDDSYTRSGLREWEGSAVTAHFEGCQRIVVTSAGGGREVLALLRQGRDAVGFEPEEKLVGYGAGLLAQEGFPGHLMLSSHDQWPIQARSGFDAAIIGWGAYMLIPGRSRRIEYLTAARSSLPVGAPVLLSFFVRTQSEKQLRVAYRISSALRRLRRRELVDFGDVLEPNRLHCFTRSELADELECSGFQLVDYGSGDYGWAVARAT